MMQVFILSAFNASVIVPLDSLPFPLVDPTLCLELHRQRHNIVGIFAISLARSDNLLPAHGTLRGAFAGLGTLVFTRDEGFHEAGVAE